MNLTLAPSAYQASQNHDDKRPSVIAATAVLSTVASIAIFLRFFVQLRIKARRKADDYIIFFAWILSWGTFVDVYYETRNGLGLHERAVTEAQSTRFFKGLSFGQPAFIFTVMLTQLSILLLYRRIFTQKLRWFRHALYTIGIICLISGLAIFFLAIFHCRPFNYSWDKSIEGHCSDTRAPYIIHDIIVLLLDISIYVIPMPVLWITHPELGTKIAFAGMFLVGSLVCVINIVRLPILLSHSKDDITWNDACPSVWAHAELCLGIMSACLPCFRPLFKEPTSTPLTKRRKSSTLTPQKRSNKSSADTYRTLDGKMSPFNGSKIALVPSDHWSLPPLAYQGPSTRARVTAERVPPREDIEAGLSPNAIGVTHDFAVSREER